MPPYLNRVELIGNLVADPSASKTKSFKNCVTFTMATSSAWGEEMVTEYHECVAFGKTGYACGLMKKGDSVYFEGQLQTRKWSDKEGVEHKTKQIVGHKILRLKEAGAARKPK